jgi:hypothetical protein
VAAQFGVGTDRVSRAGAVPDPTAGFTILGWARVDTDTNAAATLARVWTAALTTVATFATGNDGLTGPNYFTGGGTVSSSTNFVPGEWRRVAFTCLGTNGTVYAATALGATEVDAGIVAGNPTPAGVTLAGRDTSDGSETLVGTLAYWRIFPTQLSQAQVEAEWASPTAVQPAWADWPLAADLNDISGNARHLSAGTTPVDFVAGPDLPSDPETAELAGTLPVATMTAEATATAEADLAGVLPLATMSTQATASSLADLSGVLPRAVAHFEIVEANMAPSPVSEVLCSSWATVEDLDEDDHARLITLGFTDSKINAYLMRASELLWAFSGRQWLGNGCEEDAVLLSFQPVPGTGTWPYSASWGRCGCWAGATVLDGRPYPAPWQGQHIGRPVSLQLPRKSITSIVSVTVDGALFTDWTMTPNGWLQRTDGQGWSVCDGDTEVTYQFGDPPPAGGRDAAIELGIEMLLDRANSDECRLPPNTVSVTRQGLTMELMSTDRPEFRTALPLVDMWLEAVNPYRRPQSATVWSPDVPRLMRQGAVREV